MKSTVKTFLSLMIAAILTCSLLPCGAVADEPVTLTIASNSILDETIVNAYTAETGVRVELKPVGDIMDEMASAFAIRNDQVDMFAFTAFKGLYAVKEHGYYAPLEGNATLAARLNDLYPVFRDVLTHDGHMVGWVLDAQPLCYSANASLLSEYGLSAPETFSEMLNVCEVLTNEDALDDETAMFDIYSYTAESVMGLYMNQYIMASGMNGGIVDFTRPEFAATADRIRALPKEATPNWEAYDYVFCLSRAYTTIRDDMTALPKVFEDQAATETYMSVVTVNPYSARKDAAMDFLAYYASKTTPESYMYDATLTEPVKNSYVVEQLQDISVKLQTLERIENPTPEQLEEIETLRINKAACEENQWLISEEDIAFYRDFVQNLSISEASPITYDEALRTCTARFLNGAYDAAGFAAACQEHIAMIYQEHGIPME